MRAPSREAGHNAHLITYGHGTSEDTSGLPLHRGGRIALRKRRRAPGPASPKPLLDLALVATVQRVAREGTVSTSIFAHNYEALLVALAARACPVVYHAHNTMEDELPHYFQRCARGPRGFGRWLDQSRVSAPRPRPSQCAARPPSRRTCIACGCDPARVQVVPPPVWTREWEPMRVGDALPPVLYAGNLDPYQNLPLLLAAMDIVRNELPHARLHLATSANDTLPGAETVGTADFDSLRNLLAHDAVFAIPRTAWSGYPVKILNAMAVGMPVVACASTAHALTHNETGLIVPDDDANAFAEALLRLLRSLDDRKRLGTAAQAQITRTNSPNSTAQALLALFHACE
jgi:glycosyltransferase involved in cell wall biosynthesis